MGSKVYLKFKEPNSNSPFIKDGSIKGTVKKVIEKFLTIVFPKANPDFEELIGRVRFWKIEYDKIEKATFREIGFDFNGEPIIAMPLGNNLGYWVDNDLKLKDYKNFEPEYISGEEFENNWIKFKKEYKRTIANKSEQ